MPSIEKLSSNYPRFKEYLQCKELLIKEILSHRCNILNRRDFHAASIQKELQANRELLLVLGYIVDESMEGFVSKVEDGEIEENKV
jgi:hypothetical protein